jgi:tetratricopeptide (TPR) repeat protein
MRRVLCGAWLLLTTALASAADVDAQLKAARDHGQSGRYEEALEAYDALATAADLSAAQRERIALGRSAVFEATGPWQDATEAIRAAAADQPKSAVLPARLAQLEFAQGRYDAAQEHAEQALRLDADQPLAHLVRGHVATETSRFDDALREYQWCVRYYNRAQPTDADTLLVIAEGSLQYARWKSVNSVFDFVVNTLCPDALKDNPHCWQAHLISGQLLLEKYNKAQAVPELNQALAINPHSADVSCALGEAALQDHDYAEAEKQADRALATNPGHLAALLLKADIRLADGDAPAALEFVERALAVNRVDQRILARQAECHLIEDGVPRDEELLQVFFHLDAVDQLKLPTPSRFSRVLIDLAKHNPRPGAFLAHVGEFLDGRLKFDAAQKFYEQAIHVAPQLSSPRTNLGMLYMRTGQMEEAEKLLEQAFNADRYHVRVSNMRKVLDVLKGYDVVSTDHFVIRCDKSDRLLAEYMAEYLEQVYPELTAQYGYEPPNRTQFEVYGAAKGQGAHQWFSARMIGLPWIQTIGASTGMIVALASPTATEPFNWSRVLKHEFVHILTLQRTQFNIPHWYTEALAVRTEGLDMPEQWQELLLDRVPKGEVFTLDTVNQGFQRPKGPTDWNMAYCQSRLYARYMEESYGAASLEKLLDAFRRRLTTSEAVAEVFGVSQAEFEQGYARFLETVVEELRPGRAPDPLPLEDAQRAYEADTADPVAAARYAYALLGTRNLRLAQELAEQVNAADPKQPEAAYVLARFALRAEDTGLALALLTAALDESQPHPEVLAQLARLHLEARDNAEAARLYEIGHSRFPLEDRYLRGLAVALWRLDDADRLQPVLERLSRRQYDDAGIRKKLAQIALAQGRFDDAVRWGREAVYIDVLDAEVHALLGRACEQLQDRRQAIREYEATLQLDDKDLDTRVGLARVLIADGRKDDARPHVQKVLAVDAGNEEAKRLLESLDR